MSGIRARAGDGAFIAIVGVLNNDRGRSPSTPPNPVLLVQFAVNNCGMLTISVVDSSSNSIVGISSSLGTSSIKLSNGAVVSVVDDVGTIDVDSMETPIDIAG
jgi:hypothetical protein